MELTANNEDALSDFPFYMQSNINILCLNGKLGLIPIKIDDINVVPLKGCGFNNHLKIRVPYGGKNLTWEIMFDPFNTEFAPDFEFNDDNFLANPDVDFIMDNVPSWEEWDIKNEQSLTKVLKEFRNLYKKYQLEKLITDDTFSKINQEYQNLINKHQFSPDDIEVWIENNNVNLLVALKIKYDELPEYIQPEPDKVLNAGEDYVHLRVSYLGPNRVTTVLMISPRMEQVLVGTKQFHIPEYNRDTPLITYINNVMYFLEEQIEKKIMDYQKRRRFMSCLVRLDPEKLIDFDVKDLMNVSMLYIVDGYEYFIEFVVDYQFPHKEPKLYHYMECEEADCKELIKNVPWNNNKSENELINNIFNYLNEELPRSRKNHKH